MLADREGRLEDRPKRIKGELLPFDSQEIDPLLNELQDRAFILRYKVEGAAFIQILAFHKHQNPHHKEQESVIPPPPSPRHQPLSIAPKPEALPPCNKQQATGLPEASPGLAPVYLLVEEGVNRADSLNLIPDSKDYCSPSASESADDGFAAFWGLYPKKVARPAAEKAWRKLKPDGQTTSALMAGLEIQKASEQWNKNRGQFIPHASSWLNGRRWEDEGQGAPLPSSAQAANPVFAGAI